MKRKLKSNTQTNSTQTRLLQSQSRPNWVSVAALIYSAGSLKKIMKRTKIGRCFATDRISNLPCDVVDHILTCLPLRDAVRTSILSKEWRYKWVTIPKLVFNRNFEQKSLGNHNLGSIIDQVLSCHKGSILEFVVCVTDFKTRPAIERWLYVLSNHRIEKLALSFPSLVLLPSHLYTFDNLRSLYLGNCELRPPTSFNGFGRLVRLYLSNVRSLLGALKMFISKCPMLEDLRLVQNGSYGVFEIDAPNLKSFLFSGKLSVICFKNAPLLANIIMTYRKGHGVVEELANFQDYEIFGSRGNNGNLVKVFGNLSSIKSLHIDGFFLKFLARVGGVPRKLPNNLNNLRFLRLSRINFSSIVDIACALCLIGSSPNLLTLEIVLETTTIHGPVVETADQFLKGNNNCFTSLSHLEIVKIHGFSGSKPEMEIVKLFLSVATVLRKLEIKSRYAVVTEKGSQILRQLTKFPRASSKAGIIFQDPSGR